MDTSTAFWLICLEPGRVSVSLAQKKDEGFQAVSLGPWLPWSDENEEAFLKNVDQSLSEAAAQISLPENDEPSSAAFVLSPFWVGNDGRIVEGKLKLIEKICRQMKLTPMGFISDDEAIIEESNIQEGLPVSFVLLHFDQYGYTLSLVYLGKVKERLRQELATQFSPNLLEGSLINLQSQSTLPPQIVIFGEVPHDIIESIKNYHWTGKKDIETFLHFPSVRYLPQNEVISTFVKSIALQLSPAVTVHHTPVVEIEDSQTEPPLPPPVEENPVVDSEIIDTASAESVATPMPQESSATEFGFGSPPSSSTPDPISNVQSSPLPVITYDNYQQSVSHVQTPPPPPRISPPKISLPKPHLSLPHFKLPRVGFLPLLPLALSPLLVLIPFLFSKAKINLYVTPYQFNQTLNTTIGTAVGSQYQVRKQTFDLSVTSSVKTTGTKTVGDKAQGEVTIFNKLDKVQNVPKGAIIVDPIGKKFELANAVSVASSSSNLDQGVITLGQTKAVVKATDIGPEFNINKDLKFTFKDFPESTLIAKANMAFSGGSKQQVSAVAASDKTGLETQINQEITNKTNQKVKTDLPGISGVLSDTIQIKKNRVEFSREVGEQSDDLTASVNATVSVFIIDDATKNSLINKILAANPDYQNADSQPSKFTLNFKPTKSDENSATGTLSLAGTANPKIDLSLLRRQVSGKSLSRAKEILRRASPRIYKVDINTNMPFLSFVNPLPFPQQNITIDVITQP